MQPEDLRSHLQQAVAAVNACLAAAGEGVLLFGEIPLSSETTPEILEPSVLRDLQQVLIAGNAELSVIMAKEDLMPEAATQGRIEGASLDELRRRLQVVREFREATVAMIHA